MTPEGKVKAKIRAYLKALGVWHFCPVSNGMGVHGIPDILCCWRGRFIGIEVKAPGRLNNVSPLQQQQIDAINAAGGIALAVDDVEQIKHIFEGGPTPTPPEPGGRQKGSA